MQKRDAKKLCAVMLSVTAMMLFAGFGMRDDSKGEPTSMLASAITLTDVRRGDVFLLDEQPRSLLMINVTKAGNVLVSDVAMTKAKLFSEIEKRVRRYGEDFPVMIAVDRDTQYKDVAKVVDLCAEAGVRGEVSFLGMRSRRSGICSTLKVGFQRTDNRPPQGAAEQEVLIKIQIGPDKQNVILNQHNGNKHILFDRLDQHVKGLADRSKDATVLLACTPDAPHGNLMRVLDICQECKMTCRLTEQLLEKASVEEFLPIFKIQIGADTKCVVVNGRGISFKDLDCYIKKLSEKATETIVFLSCTQDSPHGSLVRVLDICYKYKMYKLAIFSVGSNERDSRDERKGGGFLWGWPHKTSSLLRNPDIELEVGKYGIVLTPEEQRASQLVIDVDRHGDCWVANRRINLEQISKLVKDRYLEYLDFLCMVRADRNARHVYVHEVFGAFLRGQSEACKQNPKVSAAEPKISIVALVEAHEDEDVYSRLDVYFPFPSQNPADGSGPWWANIREEDNELEENEPPPEDPPPPDVEPDVQVDVPNVSPVEVAEVASPTAEPQSVKVASVDAMLNIKRPVTMKSMAGTARNASVRDTYTYGGTLYGDPRTEAAVMKALRWLKLYQNADGSWPGVKPAMTGFAVLTYLAHGETPTSPEFGKTVERGLGFLINSVREKNGKVVFAGSDGHEYAFLIATYAMCEAYGMTHHPIVKDAAEKGLARIVKGQSLTGGWDYNINPSSTRDDLSFAGWALQALKVGKMVGLNVDGMDACIKRAIKCLQMRNFRNGGFSYTAGGKPTGLTATGCLAMQLLGHGNTKEVQEALDFMKDWRPTFDKETLSERKIGACPQYYCYYATQCKYQAGMGKNASPENQALWKKWNADMKALYPSTIIVDKNKDGTPVTIKDAKGRDQLVGHWVNKDAHTSRPVMDTCLAALQLMVYYRYLPTKRLEDTKVEDKKNKASITLDL